MLTPTDAQYYPFNGRDNKAAADSHDRAVASSALRLSAIRVSRTTTLLQKRPSQVMEPDKRSQLKRRMSSPDHIKSAPNSASAEQISNQASTYVAYTPIPPEWEKHKDAWGYLQSLRSIYSSSYLKRTSFDTGGRTGYLLGRSSECDIVIDRPEISLRHCLIYMECGNDGKTRGISVYLQDYSSNGTYVNGQKIGKNNHKMLRSGDRIQLHIHDAYKADDYRDLYFRIILPTQFETGTFHEEYKISNILGRGNFAVVYRARHKATKMSVAVKVVSKESIAKRPRLLASIIQEVGILMSLEAHPGVIQISGVFNEPKYIYLVLEYVREGELFQYVYDNEHLSEAVSRFVFWQLFSATQFLHRRNIAHRDLKPENVLLVDKRTMQVKISDFGLAKMQNQFQMFQTQCGTPNYVAPEILKSNRERAEESSQSTMKEQICNGNYDFPSPKWDTISAEAKCLIRRLLTVEPAKRASTEEAMEHPWMKMEPESMQRMRDAIDPQQIALIESHNVSGSFEATQSL